MTLKFESINFYMVLCMQICYSNIQTFIYETIATGKLNTYIFKCKRVLFCLHIEYLIMLLRNITGHFKIYFFLQ